MTAPMTRNKQNNRKYLRTQSKPLNGIEPILFLVYEYEAATGKITSEGPYTDASEADLWMRQQLAQGVCAWMVSYNG